MQLTATSTGWQELIESHLAAGDTVEVRIETPALSPAQFGERVGLSRTAVMKWVERGRITAELHGTYHRIPVSEVESFRKWYVSAMASDLAQDL
jgi:excisionase family DNA binding protein